MSARMDQQGISKKDERNVLTFITVNAFPLYSCVEYTFIVMVQNAVLYFFFSYKFRFIVFQPSPEAQESHKDDYLFQKCRAGTCDLVEEVFSTLSSM